MRFSRFVYLMGIAFVIMGQSLFAQSKAERKEQLANQVTKIIDSGRFKIDVDRAIPAAGRSVTLTSSYSLRIHGDSILASLPYFGRAYSAPYGGSGGIQFEEIAKDKKISPMKKGGSSIQFKVKTKDDSYTFQVDVFSNGSSTIRVSPVNKQSISFYGDLDLEAK